MTTDPILPFEFPKGPGPPGAEHAEGTPAGGRDQRKDKKKDPDQGRSHPEPEDYPPDEGTVDSRAEGTDKGSRHGYHRDSCPKEDRAEYSALLPLRQLRIGPVRHGLESGEIDVLYHPPPAGLSEEIVPRAARWWNERVEEFLRWQDEQADLGPMTRAHRRLDLRRWRAMCVRAGVVPPASPGAVTLEQVHAVKACGIWRAATLKPILCALRQFIRWSGNELANRPAIWYLPGGEEDRRVWRIRTPSRRDFRRVALWGCRSEHLGGGKTGGIGNPRRRGWLGGRKTCGLRYRPCESSCFGLAVPSSMTMCSRSIWRPSRRMPLGRTPQG